MPSRGGQRNPDTGDRRRGMAPDNLSRFNRRAPIGVETDDENGD